MADKRGGPSWLKQGGGGGTLQCLAWVALLTPIASHDKVLESEVTLWVIYLSISRVHMLTSLAQAQKSVKDNSPDVPGQTWKCLSGPKLVRKTILKDGRHDACSPQIVSKSMHWSVYSCRFLVFCSCGRCYPDDAGPWKGPRASREVPCLASHRTLLGVDRRRSDVPPMPLPIGDRHRSDSRRSLMSSLIGVRLLKDAWAVSDAAPASTDGAGFPEIFGLLIAYFPRRH